MIDAYARQHACVEMLRYLVTYIDVTDILGVKTFTHFVSIYVILHVDVLMKKIKVCCHATLQAIARMLG